MLKPMRPSFPQHRRDLVEVRMRAYIFIALSPRQPSREAPLAKRDRDLSRDRQALSSGPRSELDWYVLALRLVRSGAEFAEVKLDIQAE